MKKLLAITSFLILCSNAFGKSRYIENEVKITPALKEVIEDFKSSQSDKLEIDNKGLVTINGVLANGANGVTYRGFACAESTRYSTCVNQKNKKCKKIDDYTCEGDAYGAN